VYQTATDAGKFSVHDPEGVLIGIDTVGAEFTTHSLSPSPMARPILLPETLHNRIARARQGEADRLRRDRS
jgi:hypothetical protein